LALRTYKARRLRGGIFLERDRTSFDKFIGE